MIADIMGLLNIDQVNKFTKDERKWTVLSKNSPFFYVNLLNNRYNKLYKSDKNIYYIQKTEEYQIILLTNPIISSNVMV